MPDDLDRAVDAILLIAGKRLVGEAADSTAAPEAMTKALNSAYRQVDAAWRRANVTIRTFEA